MSVTIRKINAKAKDPVTGELKEFGLFGSDALEVIETKKQEAVTAVTEEKDDFLAAIQDKGETTLASIPNDYTELANDVSDLKGDLSDNSNVSNDSISSIIYGVNDSYIRKSLTYQSDDRGKWIVINNGVASITENGAPTANMRVDKFLCNANSLVCVRYRVSSSINEYGFICVDNNNNVLLNRLGTGFTESLIVTPVNTTQIWVVTYGGGAEIDFYERDAFSIERADSNITDILSRLGTFEYAVNTLELGYLYVVSNDNTIEHKSSSNYRNRTLSVSYGDFIRFRTRLNVSDIKVCIFSDGSGNVINYIRNDVKSLAYYDYAVAVPYGATMCYINGYGAVGTVEIFKYYDSPTIQGFVNEQLFLNTQKRKIDGEETTGSSVDIDTETNKIIIKETVNYRVGSYSIEAGKVYQIKLRVNNTNGQAIAFTDGNNNCIQSIYISGNITAKYEYLKAPIGATKLYITSYASGSSVFELTQVATFRPGRMISIQGGNKPIFSGDMYKSQANSRIITISLPDSNIYLRNAVGDQVDTYTISKTQEPRTFSIGSEQALIWNLNSNLLEVVSTPAIPYDSVTLFAQVYGVPLFGEWLPLYEELYGSGIKNLQKYVGMEYSYDTLYCDEKIAEFRTKQLSIGDTGDAFVFVSDTHNQPGLRNNQETPRLIGNICKSAGLNKVIFGGDAIYATGTESEMYEQLWLQVESYKRLVSPWANVYNIIGNHDVHITNTSTSTQYSLTNNEVYSALFTDQENRIVLNENDRLGMYYYFDNTKRKIRYICLNSQQSDKTLQVSWLSNAFTSLPLDFMVVVCAHVPMIVEHSHNYDWNESLYAIIKNYTNKIIGIFAGHSHRDFMKIKDGIVHICINADANVDRQVESAQFSPTHGACDIICIDRVNSRCDLIRVGAGGNRAFKFGNDPEILDLGTGTEGWE